MCKKFLGLGLVAAIGLGALVSTGAWSYVKTGYSAASKNVRDSIPIEWEIERARQMIDELKPEIKRNLEIVTREEVEVEKLAAELVTMEEQLADSRADILRLKGDLEKGAVRYVYAGRSFSEEQVREDLANRFKRFQMHEQTTLTRNKVLAAREQNLEAARRKLDEMLAAKRELEVQIESLQARLTMVQVAQASNPVSIDDSHLSETRQLLDSIRTKIDVAEKMNANSGYLEGTIPLDEPTSPELLDEIADYFGEGRAEVETLVSSQGL